MGPDGCLVFDFQSAFSLPIFPSSEKKVKENKTRFLYVIYIHIWFIFPDMNLSPVFVS